MIDQTDTFGPGDPFCHSVALARPFNVARVQEEVLKLEEDGSLTVVQARKGSNPPSFPTRRVAGFCVADAQDLVTDWGTGEFIMRDYRRRGELQLLAEGRFTLDIGVGSPSLPRPPPTRPRRGGARTGR